MSPYFASTIFSLPQKKFYKIINSLRARQNGRFCTVNICKWKLYDNCGISLERHTLFFWRIQSMTNQHLFFACSKTAIIISRMSSPRKRWVQQKSRGKSHTHCSKSVHEIIQSLWNKSEPYYWSNSILPSGIFLCVKCCIETLTLL